MRSDPPCTLADHEPLEFGHSMEGGLTALRAVKRTTNPARPRWSTVVSVGRLSSRSRSCPNIIRRVADTLGLMQPEGGMAGNQVVPDQHPPGAQPPDRLAPDLQNVTVQPVGLQRPGQNDTAGEGAPNRASTEGGLEPRH